MATGTNKKKRFFDVHIWDQPWFVELDMKHKLFWYYMNSKSDNIGVYAHSEKMAEFGIGLPIKGDEIETIFNVTERNVENLGNGRFLLINFLKEQHCSKNPILPINKIYVSYMNDIKVAGLIEYFAVNQPDVVSIDTLYFFKAFQNGLLEFTNYSRSNAKKGKRSLEEALRFAKSKINEEELRIEFFKSHTQSPNPLERVKQPLGKSSQTVQGKGIGNGVREEADKGGGSGLSEEVGLENGVEERLIEYLIENIRGLRDDNPVEEIRDLAQSIPEDQGLQALFELVNELEEYYIKGDITTELLEEEIYKKYN